MQFLRNTRQNAEPKDFSILPGTPLGGKPTNTAKQRRRNKNKYDTAETENVKSKGKHDTFETVECERWDEPEPHAPRADKNWHLNLRTQDVHKPANGWRRHFTRGFQTFDHLKHHLADQDFRQEYTNSEGTPRSARQWRPDRQKGHWGGIFQRDDDANFTRSSGCEGAHAGLWLHLFQAQHDRAQLAFATTLREASGDHSGARVNDNRNDGCIVEMLGKKKWCSNRPRSTDLKLHHLNFLKPEAEPDEDNRSLRVSKTPRRDFALCGPEYIIPPSRGSSREASSRGAPSREA